jgi:hypothetical protein
MTGLIPTRDGQWVRPDQVDAVELTSVLEAKRIGDTDSPRRENWRILVDGAWIVGSSTSTADLVEKLNSAATDVVAAATDDDEEAEAVRRGAFFLNTTDGYVFHVGDAVQPHTNRCPKCGAEPFQWCIWLEMAPHGGGGLSGSVHAARLIQGTES